MNGIGSLLRQVNDHRKGRDVQLPCKIKTCGICGPKLMKRKVGRIVQDLAQAEMHVAEVEDGGAEWEALHKKIERADADYHRVPAPDGKAKIFTNADVGDVVENPAEAVRQALKEQPDDGRRGTSSEAFKGAGRAEALGLWTRAGMTRKPQVERVVVYQQHGCDPVEVAKDHHTGAFTRAYDVRNLPLEDTPEMEQLSEKLELREDELEADELGFAIKKHRDRE